MSWFDDFGSEYGFVDYTRSNSYKLGESTITFEIWTKGSYTCEITVTYPDDVKETIYSGPAGTAYWAPSISTAVHEPNSYWMNCLIEYAIVNSENIILAGGKEYETFHIHAEPELLSIDISDSNGHESTFGTYVQYESVFQIKAKIKTLYGSIPSYSRVRLIADGADTDTLTTIDFTKVGDDTYECTLSIPPRAAGHVLVQWRYHDSRCYHPYGDERVVYNSCSYTEECPVAAYSRPKAVIESLYRCDANGNAQYDGSYACAIVNASAIDIGGNGKNTLNVKLKYTASSTATTLYSDGYTAGSSLSISEQKIIFAADTNEEYEVELEAWDRVASSRSTIKYVLRAAPLLDIDKNNNAFGIGTTAGEPNTIRFGQMAIFERGSNLSIYAPNMLDNGDFTNIVDQELSGSDFVFDRWHSDSTITIMDGVGVNVPEGGQMWQVLPLKDYDIQLQISSTYNVTDGVTAIDPNDVYTLAAMTTAGDIQFVSGKISEAPDSGALAMNADETTCTVTLRNGSYTWAALYKGDYHIGNLPTYHPKGYREELRACMRYCQGVDENIMVPAYEGATYYEDTDSGRVYHCSWFLWLPLKVPMRLAKPSIVARTSDAFFYLRLPKMVIRSDTAQSSSLTTQCMSGDMLRINFTCTLTEEKYALADNGISYFSSGDYRTLGYKLDATL